MAKMAAMAPMFPKKGKKGKKAKDTETKTTTGKQSEGYTPKPVVKGGGSTTRQQAGRAKRLANLKL